MLKVAMVGVGYWGPNILRNLYENSDIEIRYICDLDKKKLKIFAKKYTGIEITTDYKKVVKSSEVDAIFIATGVSTHYPLAKEAINNGKDVFIEKPLTCDSKDAMKLINLAEKKKKLIMVGHIFEYSSPVVFLENLLAKKKLGEIFYINSIRVNLGLFQKDVNVIWDLAPHDFSVLNKLVKSKPIRLSAVAKAHFKKDIEDMAYINLEYENGIMANIHVSWLDPCKVRQMTFVGSKKMVVYDDIAMQEPIKIYDKGVDLPSKYDSYGEFQLSYRYGDIVTPRVPQAEPLKLEVKHFYDCIMKRKKPDTDGASGYRVVKLIEATKKSILKDSKFIKIDLAV